MPIRFSIRQLEYFVTVGETGGVKAASERLNISLPSISTAVSKLEDELGIALFVRRHAQGLSLTPGGRRIFTAAKTVLENADALHDIADDISEQVRGPLSVGCLVSLAPLVLPELRRTFQQANPEVEFHQEEADQADLLRKLKRADIDAAITYDLEIPKGVAFEPLLALPPHAIVSPDHPLASKKSVTLKMLADLPLILLDLPLSRDYFLSLFHRAGLRPHIYERTPHLPMVRSLAANGFGYGLLNVPSINEHAPDGKPLRYIPIRGPLRPVNLGLATIRADRKLRLLAAFEEHCRACITPARAPGMMLHLRL
ncbi:MAG: LysR substrate-binding domain-containing protein [Rhodospirillales bacterium]